MIFAPCRRLLWKEYRAIRVFWLCLIGLILFLQWLTATLSRDAKWVAVPEFNLALAAPVFFALGCAGSAFAIEKEEGTIDFLAAAPVTAPQLLIGKLLTASVATFLMYAVLLPMALIFTGGRLPIETSVQSMAGLWGVAAVEALAWGTLFSLLTARPLVAISLAAAVGTAATHYLAARSAGRGLDVNSYVQAIPTRAIVVLFLLAADVLLGLRWLRGNADARRRLKRTVDRAKMAATVPAPANSIALELVCNSPDRSAILLRLIWQQMRQSGWWMLLMATISVGATLFWHFSFLVSGLKGDNGTEWPMWAAAAVMGALVFRSDQEGRRYHFFVEHNVPPRAVWISRQIPWLFTLLLSTFVIYLVRVGPTLLVARFAMTHWDWLRQNTLGDPFGLLSLPNVSLGVACAVMSYAAGQWSSMFIRSGLLAGSVGVVFGGALCAWAALMGIMHISWMWSVVPIPIVLLGATWLRAPDWIREKTSWKARINAASMLLAPALAILIAVPVYRVYQVPLIEPGFDPAAFVSAIIPEALESGEIYRRIADRVVDEPHMNWRDNPTSIYPPVNSRTNLSPGEARWLRANADLIPEILAASQRERCAFENCAIQAYQTPRPVSLIWLLVCSARELDREGKLDEALDRYLTALRAVSQFAQFSLPANCENMADQAHGIIGELCYWGALNGQTPERIHGALEKLQTIDAGILHFDDAFKVQYILERRGIADSLLPWPGPQRPMLAEILWDKLTPWERYRNLRQLNWSTTSSLRNLALVQAELQPGPRNGTLEPFYSSSHERKGNPFDTWLALNAETSSAAASKLTAFEAVKRATIIVLALEEYRLDKGKLPDSLGDLAGHYLEKVPLDPYSGKSFLYFPAGIAKPSNDLERYQFLMGRGHNHPYLRPMVEVKIPCVWSIGPNLIAREVRYTQRTQSNSPDRDIVATYYEERGSLVWITLPTYTAWARGEWFQIPDKK